MTSWRRRSAWAVAAVGLICAFAAQAEPRHLASTDATERTRTAVAPDTAVARPGRVEGVVTDHRGRPLGGAAVTLVGERVFFTVTDASGRFAFSALLPGSYVVRAHRSGFAASKRAVIRVGGTGAAYQTFQLEPAAASSGRPVMKASVGDDAEAAAADDPDEASDHPHSAAAWRVRHLPRSVLRDVEGMPVDTANEEPADEPFGGSAPADSVVASLFAGLPLTGQVQWLTTSAFDSPEQLFSSSVAPRQVAYVAIGSPAGSRVLWSLQGAATQGDLSAWVLGATSTSRITATHEVDAGFSYATQRYEGGNRAALAAVSDGNRNAGSVYGFDHWAVTPDVTITYGARYADYGYVDRSVFSPSIAVRFTVGDEAWMRTSVSQFMLAPGAEEFVPSRVTGLWLPAQRTFAPFDPDEGFRVERSRHLEIAFEKQASTFVISARGFRQDIDDQMVTLFGIQEPDRPRVELAHYATISAGDLEAFGWGIGISRPVASRIRGSVEYTITHANWGDRLPSSPAYAFAPSARRVKTERLHDITTTLETDIPETATTISAACKLNSGYARPDFDKSTPVTAARFDVQVSQRLPFLAFTRAEWEVLVAVRNLFREQLDGASVYDELLVVRPPKRIVGGVLVRF